ncbi:hypothetical protein BCR41DRAFT_236373 [Lobosporangium transversale]|uniref:Peptide hydrolase n=1 Tax=Lobosporangium transversale TaxID=64571 RepID=A0A1Y2GV21_9FUNG|nr:hypothetical protein BCR41DRAFT_236373 [Lobosporangium transversale]ORZ24913.1 hypothetical protein BCR41DRAFT_236373 [Lobosporangium transversale]|eukprot:XP_021883894.1 hypothetical protein BCR41DRAFT_236373 [Lobosporangium transversale]
MNSSFPINSRANRRRASSLENPTTPLLGSIPQRKSDRRERDEAAQRIYRMHVVSPPQCMIVYLILAIFYLSIIGIVYLARKPNAFVPTLPDMTSGQTSPEQFNPFTAFEHLQAITTAPHPFNSRVNTDITRKYIRDQLKALQAEAIALGRRNVRYDDDTDDAVYTRLSNWKFGGEESDIPTEGKDVVQGDNIVMWVGGVARSMEGDVPVDIEIDIDQESQRALLVSAHYDSVSTTYGQTDNGGGVAVALALIRHFIHHPVQHTLIFNLNNAEEDGLYGAATFMGAPPNSTTQTGNGHRWKKYVRAFVNLEGAGSGGPSLLFRATNHDIVRHYAENAPYPHASVFTNDMFKFGFVRSNTDYVIYAEHGLPGLDIAFYQRRSMYHSTTDTLPIESLYHMGANVQATVMGLCNSDYLSSLPPVVESFKDPSSQPRSWLYGKSVFYDVLGKQMFFAELWTTLLMNALVLGFGLPVLTLTFIYVGKAINARRSDSTTSPQSAETNQTRSLRSALGPSSMSISGNSDDGYNSISARTGNFRQHGRIPDLTEGNFPNQPKKANVIRATALITFIVALDITAAYAASKWQWLVNPFVRNAHPWVVLAGLGGLLTFINTITVYLATAIEAWIYGPVPIVKGATQWTLAIGVWWWIIVLIIGVGLAGWFALGALYVIAALSVFSAAAALIQLALGYFNRNEGMDGTRFGWVLVLAASLLVPGTLVLDLLVIVVRVTYQSMVVDDFGIRFMVFC